MNDRVPTRRLTAMIAGLLLGIAGQAWADPDEAWISRAPLPIDIRPLLVVVLDSSAAMAERIEVAAPYDALVDYSAAASGPVRCDPARVYWRRGPGPAPDCRSMGGLALDSTSATSGMRCNAARGALERHGFFVASRAAQWQPVAGAGHWDSLRADSMGAVECRSDRGLHGSGPGRWYATDGRQGPWSEVPAAEVNWDAAPHGDSYIFYTGNFLNYLGSTRSVEASIAEAAAASLVSAVDATDELDVALVRVSDRGPGAGGGFVALAPLPAAAAAARLPALLAGWTASGPAPLAGALIETVTWLSGAEIRYGADARMDAAALDAQNPARYQSPFTNPCRPVTIALATAGRPSQDQDAGLRAGGLPGFDESTGGCGANCLPALAQWLLRADLRSDLPAPQSAPVTWLVPSPLPAIVAEAKNSTGGKVAYAQDPLAFANVIARSFQRDAALAAPAQLSAASLLHADESSHAPAVIYALSMPQARQRWTGNLLRYGLRASASALEAPTVIGRDGQPAIDPDTGLPRPDSSSDWSDGPDGDPPLAGGAAGRLPAAESRRLYSDLAGDTLVAAPNRLLPGNSSLGAAVLGLGPRDTEKPDDVMAWLLNQSTLGDPGLQAPVTSGHAADEKQSAFAATHDGLLHAFDAVTGMERWAFLPRALLSRLATLMRDEATTVRGHGIDGPLVLHRYDPDGNGRIDAAAGEHLWVLFGLGRGGSGYYALDVASPDQPRLLWSLGPATLGRRAESWPEPVVARLSIAGARQAPGAWVVILAGGYDRAYDFADPGTGAGGASLSIIDASTGRLLWRAAGDPSLKPDLRLSEMNASLASAPRALDLDGDGYADRLYVVDVAGGVWRFDLQNGAAPAGLARARLLARLGRDPQRFYAAPDLSIIAQPGGQELAVSLGSGWFARPRDSAVTDRFYSIRDRDPASSTRVIRETDLYDATESEAPMPATAAGWFVRLERHGAGEKVVGPSLTFDHRLYFTTYQPVPAPLSAACGPPQAVRRLHTLDVRTGLPVSRTNVPGDPDEQELPGSGLPSQLRFAFPGAWASPCTDCSARPFGVAGAELFDAGFGNDPVKTSWRKLTNEADSR
jgi:type IV pilus assembly protein PilY1